MNERGFFTVIGIGFLLIAAIFVKGVQESEKNYSYITQDFKTEVELQNIADSALIEAVELIKNKDVDLIESTPIFSNRKELQHEITLNNSYDADVKVFYEYGKYKDNIGNIWFQTRRYTVGGYNDGDFKKVNNEYLRKKGVIVISVASRDTDYGKVYRRALGYFFTDEDEDGKIYFMNSL